MGTCEISIIHFQKIMVSFLLTSSVLFKNKYLKKKSQVIFLHRKYQILRK